MDYVLNFGEICDRMNPNTNVGGKVLNNLREGAISQEHFRGLSPNEGNKESAKDQNAAKYDDIVKTIGKIHGVVKTKKVSPGGSGKSAEVSVEIRASKVYTHPDKRYLIYCMSLSDEFSVKASGDNIQYTFRVLNVF